MASRKRSPAAAAPTSVHLLALPTKGQSPAELESSAAAAGFPPAPPTRGRPRKKQPSDAQRERHRKQRQANHARKFLNPPTGPRARMFGRGISSVEMLLSPTELAEYYDLLRLPTTTLAVALGWIKARGHRIGFCAV